MKKIISIIVGIACLLLNACTSHPKTYIHNGYIDYGSNNRVQTRIIYLPYDEVVWSIRRHLCQCLPMSITAIKIKDEDVRIYVSKLYPRTNMFGAREAEIVIKRIDNPNILLPSLRMDKPCYVFVIKVVRLSEDMTSVTIIGPPLENWRKIFLAIFAWADNEDIPCPLPAFTTYKEP